MLVLELMMNVNDHDDDEQTMLIHPKYIQEFFLIVF